MNKEELIAAIVENTKFAKVDTKKFLDAYIDVVTTALKFGNIVQFLTSELFLYKNQPISLISVAFEQLFFIIYM